MPSITTASAGSQASVATRSSARLMFSQVPDISRRWRSAAVAGGPADGECCRVAGKGKACCPDRRPLRVLAQEGGAVTAPVKLLRDGQRGSQVAAAVPSDEREP